MLKYLFDVDDLNLDQIKTLFSIASDNLTKSKQKSLLLKNTKIVNIFLENSTRTRISFEIAAKNLGADVINIDMSLSSTSKGETFFDTIANINQMNPDILVIRNSHSGLIHSLKNYTDAKIINAGDGRSSHPTQALLDVFSMKQKNLDFKNSIIAICGDINHSRVARSNIKLLTMLGAKINLIGPATLVSKYFLSDNVRIYNKMEDGIKNADVIMMLRLQKERMSDHYIPSLNEYKRFYCLDYEKLSNAKDDVIIMHPGPVNRDVEISDKLVDDKASNIILEQVKNGVVVREALLEMMAKD